MSRWRTRLRGSRLERGATAVEFAIVLTVLLLIIFAIIDFGRLLYVDQSMKSASREGARTAIVQTGNGTSVLSAVDDAGAAAAALAGGTLSVAYATVPAPTDADFLPLTSAVLHEDMCVMGESVTIKVTTDPFRWFTPSFLLAPGVGSVDSSTTMRCE